MDSFIKNQIFSTTSVELQLIQLAGAGDLARSGSTRVSAARRVWLRDGYPANFQLVRDLDAYLVLYGQIVAAAKSQDLDAVPQFYLRFQKINGQYVADAGAGVCAQH